MPELSPTSPAFVTMTPKVLTEQSTRSFSKVLASRGTRFCSDKMNGNMAIVERTKRCSIKDAEETKLSAILVADHPVPQSNASNKKSNRLLSFKILSAFLSMRQEKYKSTSSV